MSRPAQGGASLSRNLLNTTTDGMLSGWWEGMDVSVWIASIMEQLSTDTVLRDVSEIWNIKPTSWMVSWIPVVEKITLTRSSATCQMKSEMIIKQYPTDNGWKTTLKADNKDIKIHTKDLANGRIQRELELEILDMGDVHHTLGYHLWILTLKKVQHQKSINQTCIRYINNIFITPSVTSMFHTGALSIKDHNDIQRWLMPLSCHGYHLRRNTTISQSTVPLWTIQSTHL